MGRVFLLALFTIFLLSISDSQASIYLQHTANYQFSTDSDEAEEFKQSYLRNTFFLGAAYEKQGQLIIGVNAHWWVRSNDSETIVETQEFDMLEFGPRLILYLNKNRNFYISGAYHFYSKGTRKYGDFQEEMKGASMLASLGMQRSIFGPLHLGFSLNYHSFSGNQSSVSGQALAIEDSHTSIYPALELSYRFQ